MMQYILNSMGKHRFLLRNHSRGEQHFGESLAGATQVLCAVVVNARQHLLTGSACTHYERERPFCNHVPTLLYCRLLRLRAWQAATRTEGCEQYQQQQ
eukprot:2607-Heterococcus_DN1.PRE.3